MAVRPAYVLGLDGIVDGAYLVEVEFACKHHHVGNAGIEAHGLDIGYVALRGDMYLYTMTAAGIEDCDVGGDNRCHAGSLGCGDDFVEIVEVGIVDYGVDRQVCLDLFLVASAHDFGEVVEGEVRARPRAHVQALYAEVYCVGAGLDSRCQRLIAPHRGHYFKIFPLHKDN